MRAPSLPPPPKGSPVGRWGALSYPLYRRYWYASLARVFGLQFRFIGVPWFVVSEQGLDLSPIWVGLVAIASSLPTISLTVPAGVLADRYDPRLLVARSQALIAILMLALALGILAEAVDVWILIAWAAIDGTLGAVTAPALATLMPRLIDRRSMSSAVALTSTNWNTMRVIGPAAAGAIIAAIGIGQAFLVTAAGSALSAVLLATLRLEPVERKSEGRRGEIREGLRYIRQHRVFLATIGLSLFTSLFGMSYQVLLPIFADDILDVGSTGFGFMETAIGIGSILGTIAMIKIGSSRHAGSVMLVSAALFGLFIAAFAATRSLYPSMTLLFCAGFASSMYLNIGMTTLQLLVPDELRGRVMAVWSMTWYLSSIGGLPASALAEWIGAPWAVALGALSVTAFAALVFLVASELRDLAARAPTPAAAGS